VALPTETVQGMGFDIMYRANLQVLSTAEQLTKATLDMKA
jgi:flagellar basal body rod protein FlgC